MTLQEITNDMLQLQDLIDSARNENGEPRELTDTEQGTALIML